MLARSIVFLSVALLASTPAIAQVGHRCVSGCDSMPDNSANSAPSAPSAPSAGPSLTPAQDAFVNGMGAMWGQILTNMMNRPAAPAAPPQPSIEQQEAQLRQQLLERQRQQALLEQQQAAARAAAERRRQQEMSDRLNGELKMDGGGAGDPMGLKLDDSSDQGNSLGLKLGDDASDVKQQMSEDDAFKAALRKLKGTKDETWCKLHLPEAKRRPVATVVDVTGDYPHKLARWRANRRRWNDRCGGPEPADDGDESADAAPAEAERPKIARKHHAAPAPQDGAEAGSGRPTPPPTTPPVLATLPDGPSDISEFKPMPEVAPVHMPQAQETTRPDLDDGETHDSDQARAGFDDQRHVMKINGPGAPAVQGPDTSRPAGGVARPAASTDGDAPTRSRTSADGGSAGLPPRRTVAAGGASPGDGDLDRLGKLEAQRKLLERRSIRDPSVKPFVTQNDREICARWLAERTKSRKEGVSKQPAIRPVRRPGIPDRSPATSWRKGQLSDEEFESVRQLAQGMGKSIVLCGSLVETETGLSRRYVVKDIPACRTVYSMPEWRSADSGLVDRGVGDIDLWQGSNLSDTQVQALTRLFPGFELDPTEGYSLRRYPDRASLTNPTAAPGCLEFKPGGTVIRYPAPWQKPVGAAKAIGTPA